jgi:hypothetical protein
MIDSCRTRIAASSSDPAVSCWVVTGDLRCRRCAVARVDDRRRPRVRGRGASSATEHRSPRAAGVKPQRSAASTRDRAGTGRPSCRRPTAGNGTIAAFVALRMSGVPFHPITVAAFNRRGAEPAGASRQPARCSSALAGSTRAAVPGHSGFWSGRQAGRDSGLTSDLLRRLMVRIRRPEDERDHGGHQDQRRAGENNHKPTTCHDAHRPRPVCCKDLPCCVVASAHAAGGR